MRPRLLLALSLGVIAGCGGSFPTTATPGGATPTPSPTSSPPPVPGGGGGALDLSSGAPVGTIYFSTNYGRSSTDTGNRRIYAVRSDGSGQTLVAESANGAAGSTGISFQKLSPDGKWIVFLTTGTSAATKNAFIAKADGSGKRTLAAGDYAFDVQFSSDSQKIFYVKTTTKELIFEDATGANSRVVGTTTSGFGSVDLSADGKRLAYATDAGLFVENADGSGKAALSGASYSVVGKPCLSPDGLKAAVYLTHADSAKKGIYVLSADGSTNLATTAPVLPESLFGLRGGSGVFNVDTAALESWTPAGLLLYSVSRHENGIQVVSRYEWSAASPDGAGQRSLAQWAPTAFTNINDVGSGVLSPDKSQLVYSSKDLFRVPLAGGAPQQLTNAGTNFAPTFNSDGTRITFVSTRDDRGSVPSFGGGDGPGEAYVMNADGSGQTRLTEGFSTNRPAAFRNVKLGGNR